MTVLIKVGRKTIFLVVLSVMSVAQVLSSSLIFGFDLEAVTAGSSSVAQTTAGYLFLVAVLIILTCGSVGVS